MKNKIAVFIFYLLPKSLLSRLAGRIARIELPAPALDRFIKWYCEKYRVKDEYVIPAGGFKNFDDFFTRRLRTGARVSTRLKKVAISPVDGRIDQYGDIRETTLIQAKGLSYSLSELIPSDMSKEFKNGSYMTLYLSPGDYHRIHSPVSGRITGYYNIPGKLFTVQDYMVRGLEGLFVKNERIVTYIQSGSSVVAVCKIGALNVGRISLSYCDIATNKLFRRRREVFFDEQHLVPVKKGEEIGVFHLGSTVILLFQKKSIAFCKIKPGDSIRVGETIGTLSERKKSLRILPKKG
jgi:phosphatidylserine decarboxylase